MLDRVYLWRVYWRLAGVIMGCAIAALAAVSYFSQRVFDRELIPETERKAVTVGASLRTLVLKATRHGVDFASLYGVDQAFDDVFSENHEYGYMAITNAQGDVLYSHG